ncbi:DUF4253 domain-containing protein [Acaryochloris sp. IP29b_bin.137]|uniref:DUF4253 domain-containing protein n=1 Tax=Acaryochloris sp. IP29b_bin.137 TaxID=2969217 RepID=UPI00261CD867|nr:DUF4253 domain-containing protein [Acaryochloris sp. IP29b_bin.137]
MNDHQILLGELMELNQAIEKIRKLGTNGINCDVETEDIVQRLMNWSRRFEFEVVEVDHATVAITFASLPEDLSEFCQEVYEFCPDVLEQGYDCLPDMLEMAEEQGTEVDPSVLELMQGLDLKDEDFGLKVMERDLPRNMKLTLWWD